MESRPAQPIHYLALVALFYLTVALLSACEAQHVAKLTTKANTAQGILELYSYLAIGTFLLLLLFGNKGMVASLFYTVLYLGALSVAVAPLLYIGTNNVNNAIAVGLSGISGLLVGGIIIKVFLEPKTSQPPDEDPEED